MAATAVDNALLTTLTQLGFDQAGSYQAEPDVVNSIRVLIKFLMSDTKAASVRVQMGTSNVWEQDLIPLLIQHCSGDQKNDELFGVLIRLMLNLSLPTRKVYVGPNAYSSEEFKDAIKTNLDLRHNYQKCEENLIKYKSSFINVDVWTVLKTKLSQLLAIDWEGRETDDSYLIERILYLVRNVLHVANSQIDRNRASGEDTTHDKVAKSFVESGFGKVVTFIASSEDCLDYRGHVLEIIAQVLREQDPTSLALANSTHEKKQAEAALVQLAEQEVRTERAKKMNGQTSRHSRFGGTFSVIQPNQAKNIVTKKLVKSVAEVSLDRVKKTTKLRHNRSKAKDITRSRISSNAVRTTLQRFCDSFLDYGYNVSMYGMRNFIERNSNSQTTEDNDEVYYFHIMHVFMRYTMGRPDWSESTKISFISETLSQETVSFVERAIYRYQEQILCDKLKKVEWTQKLNYAICAFRTIITTIMTMAKSKDTNIVHAGQQIKEQILYAPEYREIIPKLFKDFNETYQTKNYLRDLMMTQHIMLKMLDGTKQIIVRGKNKRSPVKKKKKQKKKNNDDNFLLPYQDEVLRDGAWNDIKEELDTGIDSIPFDMDETMGYGLIDPMADVLVALGKVQLVLHGKIRVTGVTSERLALKLLRACRELWAGDARCGTSENELDILETLCKEQLPPQAFPKPDEKPESSEDEEGGMMDDEEEGGNYEEITEQMVDVEDILMLYATPDIISKAGLLLREYATNKPEVNRAICKLLHRVAFDLKRPAMCYQATIFYTLQQINRNQGLVRGNPTIHEIWRFGKYLLGEFFALAQKNDKLPVEVLFWTRRNEVERIQENHYEKIKAPAKSSIWTDEAEDELRQLVDEANRELNNMENPPDIPITDWIVNFVAEQFTSDDTKTSDQLRRRMIKMGLVQKANKTKRPRQTPREVVEEEREPQQQHRKRSSSVDYDSLPIEDINAILERMTFTPNVESTLKWLQTEMAEEIKDRTEEPEDDWIDRALVTSELKVSAKLEHTDFRIMLKSAGFQYPNHEHVYWRIPVTLSVNELEYFHSMLSDYEPNDDQMKDVSDVEVNNHDDNDGESSDDDFEKWMRENKPATDEPPPPKTARIEPKAFVKAVNESSDDASSASENEPDNDPELAEALKEAENHQRNELDSDDDDDDAVVTKPRRRTVLESSDED